MVLERARLQKPVLAPGEDREARLKAPVVYLDGTSRTISSRFTGRCGRVQRWPLASRIGCGASRNSLPSGKHTNSGGRKTSGLDYDSSANTERRVGLSGKLLPELETRPGLGQLASDMKVRIEKIRQEIRVLQEQGGQNPE